MKEHSWATGGKNSTKFMIMFVFLVVVILIAVTASVMLLGQKTKPNPVSEGCDDQTGKREVVMIYKPNEEFGPDCLRITSGTKVVYKNDSSAELEVGVDPHPTHTGDRQVSGGEFDLPVAPGKTASVTLEKKGEFGIHNHVNASARATIVVE